ATGLSIDLRGEGDYDTQFKRALDGVRAAAPMFKAAGLQAVVYGLVLIAFVMFEPMGLYGRWIKIRTWFELFPFYRKGMFKRQKSFQKSDRLK
ncbi:MAG: hypothetical protein RLZ64_2054, partial [Pseudomonadota bacterium]